MVFEHCLWDNEPYIKMTMDRGDRNQCYKRIRRDRYAYSFSCGENRLWEPKIDGT